MQHVRYNTDDAVVNTLKKDIKVEAKTGIFKKFIKLWKVII